MKVYIAIDSKNINNLIYGYSDKTLEELLSLHYDIVAECDTEDEALEWIENECRECSYEKVIKVNF